MGVDTRQQCETGHLVCFLTLSGFWPSLLEDLRLPHCAHILHLRHGIEHSQNNSDRAHGVGDDAVW